MWPAGIDLRRPAFQAGALPAELRPHAALRAAPGEPPGSPRPLPLVAFADKHYMLGGGPCFPQPVRSVATAYRSHPLPVSTPASHRRGPPGRCPLPLATPDARYGPRSASATAVVPSLPWTVRRRPNSKSHASPSIPRREIDAAGTVTSSVSLGFSRTMFSKPLAHPSSLDRRPVAQVVGVLRGGALEPEPRAPL